MLRPKLNLVIQDPNSGRARPGAWVSFYLANTFSLAPLYADDDATQLGNPIQANSLGQVAVRVPVGVYDVSATVNGSVPTVIEDVVAWTPDDTSVHNPGEIIVGGPNGTPETLPPGDPGEVLAVLPGTPPQVGWTALVPGVGLPLAVKGSLLSYPADNVMGVVLPGAQSQLLVMNSGVPTWGTAAGVGVVLPINQPGDLMVGDAGGLPARLPRGTTGQVLTVLGSGLLGYGPGSVASVIIAEGDLIIGDVTGLPSRLPKGIPEQVLRTNAAGKVEWTTPPVERSLYLDTALVGSNAGTTEQALKSYLLAVNMPPGANDRLRIRVRGNYGSNSSNKTIRVYYGALLLITMVNAINLKYWQIECELVRVSGTAQRVESTGLTDGKLPEVYNAVGAENMAAQQLVKVTTQVGGGAANQIFINIFEVRWLPA